MAPVSGSWFRDHNELTGEGINSIISYWPASQKTRWHDARICLGRPRQTPLTVLISVTVSRCCARQSTGEPDSYTMQLRIMPRNYGLTAGLHQNRRIPYERALRNLVVLMFSHYVNHLECTGSLEGHRTLMMYECLVVAAALGGTTVGNDE